MIATATNNKKTINDSEKKDKRARSIAAMGLVNREGDRFRVLTPSLRGKQTAYEVWRDESNKIRCNCLEFEEAVVADESFRCEHILAVKYALVAQNTESVTKQPVAVKTEIEIVTDDKSVTESRPSERGEQKIENRAIDVLEIGQTETNEVASFQLANTIGDNQMTPTNLTEVPFLTADEAAGLNNQPATSNNVLNFTSTLKELRKNVDPDLVKTREGWRDRNGNVHMVDYVEWHTVADILDENAPNWTHTVKDIRQIGDIMTVTVAITIDGITREGIGTGVADSEMGIKKAEHDALKRAAVKFGIARDLYKKESDTIEREGSVPTVNSDNNGAIPANPIAKSLSDLVTAKQLGMIRAIAREMNIDAETQCESLMSCRTDELSKRAASSLIQHLQDMQRDGQSQNVPLRRAG